MPRRPAAEPASRRLAQPSVTPSRRSADRSAAGAPGLHAERGSASEPRVFPIQRQTLAGMTLEAIRERILSGAYPEGEPLRQDAIAEELGVSRIPIREALRQLEAEGLVVFNPHRGAVVSTLSLGEIEELFDLRAEIELMLLGRDELAVPLHDLRPRRPAVHARRGAEAPPAVRPLPAHAARPHPR